MTGNNGTADVTYAKSIDERQVVTPATPGAFKGGASYGSAYADFAQSIDPFNSYGQGSSGGSYTVQAGDSLQGIAASIWGDASLWYMLAEANGLSAGSGLTEGQTIRLPAGVSKSGHNASTFKAYDPAEIIGDTLPSTPKPAANKGKKCGVVGMILMVAIAVGVTITTHNQIGLQPLLLQIP